VLSLLGGPLGISRLGVPPCLRPPRPPPGLGPVLRRRSRLEASPSRRPSIRRRLLRGVHRHPHRYPRLRRSSSSHSPYAPAGCPRLGRWCNRPRPRVAAAVGRGRPSGRRSRSSTGHYPLPRRMSGPLRRRPAAVLLLLLRRGTGREAAHRRQRSPPPWNQLPETAETRWLTRCLQRPTSLPCRPSAWARSSTCSTRW